jgi:hypothetical protein
MSSRRRDPLRERLVAEVTASDASVRLLDLQLCPIKTRTLSWGVSYTINGVK